MRICVVCCTYNRPHLLPYILWCFERQTHADRRLLIYDDHGQYRGQTGADWVLCSEDSPAETLGVKRNRAMCRAEELFKPDVFAVWDDDDGYFPHALEAVAWACARAEWCRPSLVFHRGAAGLRCHRTYATADRRDAAYQSQWAFRRKLVTANLAKWPEASFRARSRCYHDRGLANALVAAGVSEADPCEAYPPISVYDPYHSTDRVSCVGGRAAPMVKTDKPLVACPPPLPLTHRMTELRLLSATVHPRPWGAKGDWLMRRCSPRTRTSMVCVSSNVPATVPTDRALPSRVPS